MGELEGLTIYHVDVSNSSDLASASAKNLAKVQETRLS